MRRGLRVALLGAGMLVAVTACSTRTQEAMRVTREENAHFANFTHMGYSLFRDTPQQTTKQDIVLAKNDQCPRACQWFGEPVIVQPIQ